MKKIFSLMIFILFITISYFSYARYILEYSYNANVNSAPLYFEANLDTSEFQILDNQATANLTIKNNNGSTSNVFSTNYTITLEGNSKFQLYVNDVLANSNVSSQTINGNALLNNILKIKLVPNSSSTINPSENANLKIQVTSPYIKTINIPITIVKEIKLSNELVTSGINNLNTTFDEENNSFKFSLTTQGGKYEKINIPIKNLEVGKFYQLYFDESHTYTIMPAYDFGCTVQAKTNTYTVWNDNKEAMLNYEKFTWKTMDTGSKSNQCISFFATAETMYWIWDISALQDGNDGELNVKMLKIEKDSAPLVPYADFPNAYFKLTENTDSNYASESAYKDVAGAQNMVNSQGTFFTKSTYDETLIRIETMKGKYEKLYVPLKNLVVGQNYTLSFSNNTKATLSSSHYYGYEVTGTITSAMTSNDNSWAQNSSNFINLKGGTETSSTTFTATAETMYWVWSFSKFEDFDWTTVHVTNVSITEQVSTLSLTDMGEEEKTENNLDQNIEENENDLETEIIVTETNTILDTIDNTDININTNTNTNINTNIILNTVTNDTINEVTNTTIGDNSNTATNERNNFIEEKNDLDLKEDSDYKNELNE